MKLFQKLLLAPAALGLFAPMVANANESNFRDVTTYSQDQAQVSVDTFKPLSNKNPLLAGGEGIQSSQSSDFDVDTFSATTSASFTANFAVGKQDGDTSETINPKVSNYEYEIALTSSFTGNDSLDVVMVAGTSNGYTELDMTNNSAKLTIDSISYTSSYGDKLTTFVGFGDGVAGSSLYNTACVYGAQTDTLSNCGVSAANIDEGLGAAFGAGLDFGNGVTAAVGYEGQGSTTKGFFSREGVDAVGAQVAYTGDNFGVSVSWADIENHSAANAVTLRGATSGSPLSAAHTRSVGFNAYYTPELSSFPTLSAGIETNHDDSVQLESADQTSHYFVGLQWDDINFFNWDGTLGAAYGSKTPYTENTAALNMYEVFYSYNYADGMTITPLIYSKDNSGSRANETGIVLKTTFSF